MELSVVVPAYREGPRIYENLQRLLTELDELKADYEVVVVYDGNTDATASEAARVRSARVKVLDYPVNRGKLHVLNDAVPHLRGEIVAFSDAASMLEPICCETGSHG